jgi:hypothetical protein
MFRHHGAQAMRMYSRQTAKEGRRMNVEVQGTSEPAKGWFCIWAEATNP